MLFLFYFIYIYINAFVIMLSIFETPLPCDCLVGAPVAELAVGRSGGLQLS